MSVVPARMRAVVQDRYGPPEVLRIAEIERPIPRDGEILIRVRAATVSQTDTHARAADPFFWRFFAGLRRPRWKTLGVDLAGEVEAVGSGVTRFHVGDVVFGSPPGFGSHAEFICLRETAALAIKPAGLSFEEAAAVPDGAAQALATLRQAAVQKGQRIVIYGGSGSLGTAAVQLARHFGAHVTAVCGTSHVELVRSLGADVVVDYLHEDFTRTGQSYDAIIDAVGKFSFHRGRRALRPGGVYVATDLGPYGLESLVMAVASRWVGSRRLKFATGRRDREDVEFMKGLIEAGEYRPVIDSIFPMDHVVEAHRQVETWHKTGNVVLTIGEPRPA